MQERHTNRLQYFDEQAYTTEKYVIPFINEVKPVNGTMHVLEIGCGEAGNLLPFLRMGCTCIGIDMSDFKVNIARDIFAKREEGKKLTLIVDDIFNRVGELGGSFDLIIIRDTLEHIHGHEKFMKDVKQFLKPDGKIFLGFPPWQNPFGGHQQIAESKIISKVPFFHLLPKPVYLGILKMFGESQSSIDELLNIRSTRITIGQFLSMMNRLNYKIDLEQLYFINPNYEVKFKLKPRLQSKWITSIPYFRNFMVTTCYYLVSPKIKFVSDILLIIIALIILSSVLRRIIFFSIRKSFQKAAEDFNKANRPTNTDTKKQKTFWSNTNSKSNRNDGNGDYIDYEEIK